MLLHTAQGRSAYLLLTAADFEAIPAADAFVGGTPPVVVVPLSLLLLTLLLQSVMLVLLRFAAIL